MIWLHRMTHWAQNAWRALIDRPFPSGTVFLNRYEADHVLGMGSYGISYACWDRLEGKRCVVKQVRPSRKHSHKGLQAFDYETRILSQLDHPAIPKLYGRFEDKSHFFFAMEYMEGKNLEDLLFDDGIRFSERESLQLINQLLDIIAYLHELNIVHRDIRIPNVIVKDHEVQLIDFGLARFIGEKQNDDIDDYFIEKRLRREIHCKSDFYSLGHFLLFLLYSAYENDDNESGSWETELPIHPLTKRLLRRMLQLDKPFMDIEELRSDLHAVLFSRHAEEDAVRIF